MDEVDEGTATESSSPWSSASSCRDSIMASKSLQSEDADIHFFFMLLRTILPESHTNINAIFSIILQRMLKWKVVVQSKKNP